MRLTLRYIFIITCLSGNYTPNIGNFSAKLGATADHLRFKLCIHHIVMCFSHSLHFGFACVCVVQQPDVACCMLGLFWHGITGDGGKESAGPPLMRLFVSPLCNLSNPALDGLRFH